MKFKIDENLPESVKHIIVKRGYDCHSVYDEGIQGGPDDKLIDICREEKRHLLTLDLDFSNIVTYPPEQYHGIIVLRLSRQDALNVTTRVGEILNDLANLDLAGHLVIVGNHKVRYR